MFLSLRGIKTGGGQGGGGGATRAPLAPRQGGGGGACGTELKRVGVGIFSSLNARCCLARLAANRCENRRPLFSGIRCKNC